MEKDEVIQRIIERISPLVEQGTVISSEEMIIQEAIAKLDQMENDKILAEMEAYAIEAVKEEESIQEEITQEQQEEDPKSGANRLFVRQNLEDMVLHRIHFSGLENTAENRVRVRDELRKDFELGKGDLQ